MNVDLTQTVLPMEPALFVHWCVESDMLGFRITLKDKPLIRRGVLSTISVIYDPMGLAAPFLMTETGILQGLCSAEMDWDDEIGQKDRAIWENGGISCHCWRILKLLVVSNHLVMSTRLHHFSGASQIRYGQSGYVPLDDTFSRRRWPCALFTGYGEI